MAPLLTSLILLLSTTALIAASVDFVSQRFPNGGALFSLTSRQLAPRQGLAECGGDPDCTSQTWGCQCGFVDDSWLNAVSNSSVLNSGFLAVLSSALLPHAASPAPTPASWLSRTVDPPSSSSRTVDPPSSFSRTVDPASSSSRTVDPASATCTVNGGGCDCSDRSHPAQDEDARCCIWSHEKHVADRCFA